MPPAVRLNATMTAFSRFFVRTVEGETEQTCFSWWLNKNVIQCGERCHHQSGEGVGGGGGGRQREDRQEALNTVFDSDIAAPG